MSQTVGAPGEQRMMIPLDCLSVAIDGKTLLK
jgi:hypothetical protein